MLALVGMKAESQECALVLLSLDGSSERFLSEIALECAWAMSFSEDSVRQKVVASD